MDNVDVVIKQELNDQCDEDLHSPGEGASPGKGSEHQHQHRLNASPARSLASNSSSSNNGGGYQAAECDKPAGNEATTSRRKRKSPPIKNGGGSFSSETDDDLERNNYASRMLRDLASHRQTGAAAHVKAAEEGEEEEEDGEDAAAVAAPQPAPVGNPLLKSYLGYSSFPARKREFAVMTEERLKMQQINCQPRRLCPICGDKANGLHYGIYSCEGCKNFFKRSVMVCQDRPYVCKFDNVCSVAVTEIDGVKQKGPRCQACRYQACLDAGMYHSGVQRTRGGRHATPAATSAQQGSAEDPSARTSLFNGFVARLKANCDAAAAAAAAAAASGKPPPPPLPPTNKFPKMQLPDIGASLRAAHYQNLVRNSSSDAVNGNAAKHGGGGGGGDGDEVTVTITPSWKKENGAEAEEEDYCCDEDYDDDGGGEEGEEGEDFEGEDAFERDYLSRFRTENLVAEVKLLKSRNRELSKSNAEKEKQIWLYRRQLSVMKRALVIANRRGGGGAAAAAAAAESPGKNLHQSSDSEFGGGEGPALQPRAENPTLKALLLNESTFPRKNGAAAASGGSLTLTPVKHPKKGGGGTSSSVLVPPSDNPKAAAASGDDSQNGRHESMEFNCGPFEPTDVLQTVLRDQ